MRAVDISNVHAMLWLAVLFAELVLFILLIVDREYRRLPAFVTFIALATTHDAILLLVAWYCERKAYFFTFWGLRSIELVVLFAVVAELYSKVFGSIDAMAAFPKALVRFGVAAGSTVCLGVALDLFTGEGAVLRPFLQLERGITAAAFALIGIIVLTAWFYGLPWFSRQIAISLGITFNFGLRAVLDQVSAFYPGPIYDLIQGLLFVTYLGAVGIWLIAFGRSTEPKCALSQADMAGIDMTLRQLGRALKVVNRRVIG